MSDHATAIATETPAASHEATANEEAHRTSGATGRAVHDETAAAGATTRATALDHLFGATSVMAERVAEAEVTADEAETTEDPVATTIDQTAHHPPALAAPTSLLPEPTFLAPLMAALSNLPPVLE